MTFGLGNRCRKLKLLRYLTLCRFVVADTRGGKRASLAPAAKRTSGRRWGGSGHVCEGAQRSGTLLAAGGHRKSTAWRTGVWISGGAFRM